MSAGQMVSLTDWCYAKIGGSEWERRVAAKPATAAPVRAPKAQSVLAASKRPARPEIELRTSTKSPISIVLKPTVRTVIVNEVLDWASDSDDDPRETGGYVYGRRSTEGVATLDASPHQLLELTFAAYAGEATKRRRNAMTQDVDYGRSVERTLRRQRTRQHLVGDYHSHNPALDGIPSPADLRAWKASLELLVSGEPMPPWLLGNEIPRDCWAGIIVTRSAGGSWMWPQLHGWIMRRDPAGFICEPAVVHEV